MKRYVFRTTGPANEPMASSWPECFGGGKPRQESSHETLEEAYEALCDAGYEDEEVNCDIYDRLTKDSLSPEKARQQLVEA